MSRRGIVGSVLALTAVILLLQLSWLKVDMPAFLPASEDPHEETNNLGQGPRNSTLGFQKIYYIGMPQRTDRRDMMTLMAGYLNLDFIAMDGVNGSQIAAKAYPWDVRDPPPPAPGHKLPRPSAVGCWRAHSNVWSHIISSGISSALIFEDDADFSVGIRDILEGVSQQLQDIIGARNGEPYGIVDSNSWDLLALGSCGSKMPDREKNPKAAKMVRVWNDPYAPINDKRHLPGDQNERLRMLTISKGWACTQAYAVTREGAMRLLYNVGGEGRGLDQPMDLLMAEQMSRGVLKSFAAVPSVVEQWKMVDWRDSDISPPSDEDLKHQQKGSGSLIIQSVREEISQVLGNRNIWDEIEREEGEDEMKEEESGE